MNSEPEQASRFRMPVRLVSTRSRIVAGVLALVLIVGGAGALLAKSQANERGSSSLAAIATATAPPTATPLPPPTATAKPRPTATPKPKPAGPVNYLVVRIGGCGSAFYPDLYFTNTDPARNDELFWYEAPPYPPDYLGGDAYIGYNRTEEVAVIPNNESDGPLTYTVKADRVLGTQDYGEVGYWHGTVYPCK